MAKDYKLEVAELPHRSKLGIYDNIVADFKKSVLDNPEVKVKSAKVQIPGRRDKTVQIGLAKAVRVAGLTGVSINLREGAVFIAKKG